MEPPVTATFYIFFLLSSLVYSRGVPFLTSQAEPIRRHRLPPLTANKGDFDTDIAELVRLVYHATVYNKIALLSRPHYPSDEEDKGGGEYSNPKDNRHMVILERLNMTAEQEQEQEHEPGKVDSGVLRIRQKSIVAPFRTRPSSDLEMSTYKVQPISSAEGNENNVQHTVMHENRPDKQLTEADEKKIEIEADQRVKRIPGMVSMSVGLDMKVLRSMLQARRNRYRNYGHRPGGNSLSRLFKIGK